MSSLDPRMDLTVSDNTKPTDRRDKRIRRMRSVLKRDDVQIDRVAKRLMLEALTALKGVPAIPTAFYIYAEAFRRAGDLMDEQAKK